MDQRRAPQLRCAFASERPNGCGQMQLRNRRAFTINGTSMAHGRRSSLTALAKARCSSPAYRFWLKRSGCQLEPVRGAARTSWAPDQRRRRTRDSYAWRTSGNCNGRTRPAYICMSSAVSAVRYQGLLSAAAAVRPPQWRLSDIRGCSGGCSPSAVAVVVVRHPRPQWWSVWLLLRLFVVVCR